MHIRIGFNISVPLLHGLSWIPVGLAALMVLLPIPTILCVASLPMTVAAAVPSGMANTVPELYRRWGLARGVQL